MTKIYKITEDRTWDKSAPKNDQRVLTHFKGTENECHKWIQKNTPFSFDMATKHQGYSLVEVSEETLSEAELKLLKECDGVHASIEEIINCKSCVVLLK